MKKETIFKICHVGGQLWSMCIIMLISAIISNCSNRVAKPQSQESKDSAELVENYLYDHGKLTTDNVDSAVTAMTHCDSLEKIIDSLKTKLFVSNYKLERIKYYVGITDRNPSQVKFLRGWLKRVLEK